MIQCLALYISSNLIFTITLKNFLIINYRKGSNAEGTVFERLNIPLHISQSRKSKSSLSFFMVCIVSHTVLWCLILSSAPPAKDSLEFSREATGVQGHWPSPRVDCEYMCAWLSCRAATGKLQKSQSKIHKPIRGKVKFSIHRTRAVGSLAATAQTAEVALARTTGKREAAERE